MIRVITRVGNSEVEIEVDGDLNQQERIEVIREALDKKPINSTNATVRIGTSDGIVTHGNGRGTKPISKIIEDETGVSCSFDSVNETYDLRCNGKLLVVPLKSMMGNEVNINTLIGYAKHLRENLTS